MKKIKLFHLKNQMFVANGIANFIGVLLANASALTTQEPYPKEFLEYPIVHWTDALFSPFAFSFVTVMTLLYEKPVRHYLNAIRQNSSSDATQIIDAIFDILDKFIGEVKLEDDITSVVIKI